MADFKHWTFDGRFLLPMLLLFTGCLPHACGRRTGEERALLPADSLSRRVASTVPVDTLRRLWQTGDDLQLQFPRTALFLPAGSEAGRLVISDAKRDALLFFSKSGRRVRSVTSDAFATPYLIGRRADTLLVLSPRARRVSFVTDGQVVRNVTLDLPPASQAPLLWATAPEAAIFAKTINTDDRTTLTRHGQRGQITARRSLPGPRWHHAGPLLWWRDSLASLSGFRPVVRRLPPGLGTLDTLRLRGFDSPMLARSRRFAAGDVRRPPLLMPDAAASDSLLFTLNLRPGRLHIDAFAPNGQLTGRLTPPGPTQSQDVYPRALAVCRLPDGRYALAVALTDPAPVVALYHWTPAQKQDTERTQKD